MGRYYRHVKKPASSSKGTPTMAKTTSRAASIAAAVLVAWMILTTLALVFLAGRASAQPAVCTTWVNPNPGTTTIYAPDTYASFVLELADGSRVEVGPVRLGQVIEAPGTVVGAIKCTTVLTPTPEPSPTPEPETTPTPTPTPDDPGCCSTVVTPTPTPRPTPPPSTTPTPERPTPTTTPTPEVPPCVPGECLPPTGLGDWTLPLAGFGLIAAGSILLGVRLIRDRLTINAYLQGRRS